MADASTDSITSSAAFRSFTSANDSKSIVAALQSLQEKIRRLEIDRNFHQEQAEQAHASHEAYKREVEERLDRERAEHRRRESELHELVTRSTEERNRLQGALEAAKLELAGVRRDVDAAAERERRGAREREDHLREELEGFRQQASDERRKVQKLSESIDHLRAERDIVSATNKRLETTIHGISTGRARHSDPLPPRPRSRTRSSMRYQHPTQSSTARDVRAVRGGMRTDSPRRVSPARSVPSVSALDGWYRRAERTHAELRAEYAERLGDTSTAGVAEAARLAAMIDETEDQMRLLRGIRAELCGERSLDKSTTRNNVMHQLRKLFSLAQ